MDPNILRFISNYMRCRNKAQSARDAGLAPQAGQHLMNRPDIYNCVMKLTEKSVMKYGYDAHEVIERIKEVSSLDPVEFERPDGSYKNKMSEINPEARRAIKKFKVKNIFGEDPNGMKTIIGEIIEIELCDKMQAHQLLGREKNILKETKVVEHDVTSNMAAVLLSSSKRAEDHVAQLKEASVSLEVLEITGKVENGET
jgi:phage terminase small subunit